MMTPRSTKRLSLAPKRFYPDENSDDDFETSKSLVKKAVLQSAKKAKATEDSPKISEKRAVADPSSRPARRTSLLRKIICEESTSSSPEPLSAKKGRQMYKGHESDDSDFEVSSKSVGKTEITSRSRRVSAQIMTSPCVKQSASSKKKFAPKKGSKAPKRKSSSVEESSDASDVEEVVSSDDEIVVKAGRRSVTKKQVSTFQIFVC